MQHQKALVLLVVVVVIAAVAYLMFKPAVKGEKTTLKIFHAGSLSLALAEAEKIYESSHPSVDIVREPSGSVAAVRKISDLGKRADIVMVADYKVIDKYLVPRYARWNIVFVSNEVVLVYSNKSKYANEVNAENWYRILERPGVKVGVANPNVDPCGYRAFSVLYMAYKYYGDEALWREVVASYIPNVKVEVNGSGSYIYFPADPAYRSGGKLVLRDKSVDLISMVEAGIIDYAFEYRNVAEEHGLKYVRLPAQLSLRQPPAYSVYVVLYAGAPGKEKAVKIGEIRYGLTIPSNAEHPGEAMEFLKWLLYGDGKKVLEKHGFVPIPYVYEGDVPPELRG